jgi:hypothetical protein
MAPYRAEYGVLVLLVLHIVVVLVSRRVSIRVSSVHVSSSDGNIIADVISSLRVSTTLSLLILFLLLLVVVVILVVLLLVVNIIISIVVCRINTVIIIVSRSVLLGRSRQNWHSVLTLFFAAVSAL